MFGTCFTRILKPTCRRWSKVMFDAADGSGGWGRASGFENLFWTLHTRLKWSASEDEWKIGKEGMRVRFIVRKVERPEH